MAMTGWLGETSINHVGRNELKGRIWHVIEACNGLHHVCLFRHIA